MENFTFEGFWKPSIQKISFLPLLYILLFPTIGMASAGSDAHDPKGDHFSFGTVDHLSIWNPWSISPEDCDGDGVTCAKEEEDGTDPNDPCDFILESQNCEPSDAWKKMDCDGDGVDNGQEKTDGTDPLDPCDLILEHQNCTPTEGWKKLDCDGDGVDNGQEKTDGTDPLDPCDFVLEHQNCTPSAEWKKLDCDGDGVSNGQEKQDGTDPLDPCDFVLEHQDCTPSAEWKKMDCDGDGVDNGQEKTDGTDPLDPCDFVLEHQNCTPSEEWKKLDCDGDGVSNGQEKQDGTDPLDPCDFVLEHQDCTPSVEWKKLDCDGDGVSNGQEKQDGTDPLDPCDFVLEHQDCTPSAEWKKMDCDGDGVTNGDEKTDGTDPLDPCDYRPESVTLPQGGDYLKADCDGDGVTNEDEKEDGTDPLDPCDFKLESQSVDPSSAWNTSDCDGDGVTNGDEKTDGTDPLDPCDYKPESVTLTPSVDWEILDCDDDGNPNGTDPNPLMATAVDDYGSTTAMTLLTINILENDDYLPNNDQNNIGITSLSRIGGNALGTVSFDAQTGTMEYTPIVSESNATVTVIYQVCNVFPDPNVCASATVYITVGANTIDAVDDSYSVEAGTEGAITGSNVLANDTLNGDAVTLETVVLSSTPTTELTVNADGSVSVLPGTTTGSYTISYTLCDKADSSNCDTATVTVLVEAAPVLVIDAVDDSYGVEAGTEGAITGSNVLANDTLDGNPVTLETVVLSSTPTTELTVNADGSVSVVPGTTTGSYTITYTLCEVANPLNCDTATVTVLVEAAPALVIDAVDDSYGVEAGTDGVIAGSNVLNNDTLDGNPASFETVVLSSTPTTELTVNADGSVSVVPGTTSGSYTITYTLCEVANPLNCDAATVTVVVETGTTRTLDAVDDTYMVEAGTEGVITESNVLNNDTLDGNPASFETVVLSSTPTAELTVNADGSVSVVPGTTSGSYTIDYTLCDIADVEHCDTATVTVVVEAATALVIDAVDDSYSVEAGTEGVITGSSVLDNDTLDGNPVTLETVVLSSTPTTELIVNADGSVSVVPGTTTGSYTITYTLCDKADSSNCDTATVTVLIEADMALVIDAVDDSYTADGATGEVFPGIDVLANDTLDGESVTLETVVLTSIPTEELTINPDGSVSVTPGTTTGSYTISYTLCEVADPSNCDTAIVTVFVEDNQGDKVKIEVNQMLTPNGDLKNDFLFIRGVERIKSSTFMLFNRWGASVYEGKNYDNVHNVFDGRSRGRSTINANQYLPAGVYYYIFNYETDEGSFTDSEYIYLSR